MDIDILMDDAHEFLAAADKAKVRNTKISPLQEYTALTAATAALKRKRIPIASLYAPLVPTFIFK